MTLVARWPFLTFGLITFALFLLAEAIPRFQDALAPILRILIMPLWLMRTLEMVVGIGYLPGWIQLFSALPLLFLPYVAADLVLGRLRRRAVNAEP